MSDVRVRMPHVRAAKLCARGARDWCARHGFDGSALMTEGLSAESLEATGDAFALRVVAIARAEEADG